MPDPTPTLTAEQREELAEHEPVIGATYVPGRPCGSIVGCSCLNARDYRAAGYRAGQEGWRNHLAEVIARMVADAEQRGRESGVRAEAALWRQQIEGRDRSGIMALDRQMAEEDGYERGRAEVSAAVEAVLAQGWGGPASNASAGALATSVRAALTDRIGGAS